jgi:chromosome segregation ATPase
LSERETARHDARERQQGELEALQAENASLSERVSVLLATVSQADEQRRRLSEVNRLEIGVIVQQRDEQARQIAVLEAQKNTLTQRLSALEAELSQGADERRRTLDALIQQCDKQVKQLGALSEENGKLAQRVSELDAALSASIQQRAAVESPNQTHNERAAALSTESSKLAQRVSTLEAELAKSVRLAEERAAEIDRLARQRDELDSRQRLLDEEVLKAEAQIELIKDVLLRENAAV